MKPSSKQINSIHFGLFASLVLIVLLGLSAIQTSECLQNGAGPFGVPRPAAVIFEPTVGFIRQNMRLVESYVALLRSIFVGAYERPLVTSTDGPSTVPREPSPKVPPMDLPASGSQRIL